MPITASSFENPPPSVLDKKAHDRVAQVIGTGRRRKNSSSEKDAPIIMSVEKKDVLQKIINEDSNTMNKRTFAKTISNAIFPLPNLAIDLFRNIKLSNLEDRTAFLSEKNELEAKLNAEKQKEDINDIMAKESKDFLNTNFLERVFGMRDASEQDIQDQIKSNTALELQNQILQEQLLNANTFLSGQSELLTVQQEAQNRGIEIPSIASSDSKSFLSKYGVPLLIGGVALALISSKRGK